MSSINSGTSSALGTVLSLVGDGPRSLHPSCTFTGVVVVSGKLLQYYPYLCLCTLALWLLDLQPQSEG